MTKSKFGKFMVIVLVVLLSGFATAGVALADSLIADGDGIVPVGSNAVSFGVVTPGAAASRTVLLQIERGGGLGNTFKNGSNASFVLHEAPLFSISAENIVLPNDWQSQLNGTRSNIAEATLSITVPVGTDAGTYTGTVQIRAYGTNVNDNSFFVNTNLTYSYTVEATAPSDTTPPTVNITVPTPDGNNGWFVTSPVVVDITATDPSNVTAILVNGVAIPDADITGLGTTTATASYNVSGDGIHNITVTATDGATPANTGAAAGSVNTATIKIDTTDPVVTFDSSAPTVYLLYEVAAVNWDASDATSGLATPASGSEDLDTNSVGSKYIEVTATDNAGNSETYRFNYTVQYNFGGILHPINSDGTSVFKQGSTIPVKFQLRDANGDFVTNATATISLTKISNGTTGEVNEPITTGNANTGNLFRYDSTSNQYIFNLGTRNLTVGTYRITINPGDGIPRTVQFGLR